MHGLLFPADITMGPEGLPPKNIAVRYSERRVSVSKRDIESLPAVFGQTATSPEFAFNAWDKFKARLPKNSHTRRAYLSAIKRFGEWMNDRGLSALHLKPGEVQDYIEGLNVLRRAKGGLFAETDTPGIPSDQETPPGGD